MKIYKIETGNFKLDGGAMFGVVPKKIWQNVYPSDENNLCNLAMRCLLVEADGRLILIDTGIGDKQDKKFFGYYYLNGDDSLENSLLKKGFKKEDITDVLLTHLHFDHAGGAVAKDENGNLFPAFPNAGYWLSKSQWEWALNPNQREKASYLPENILPLKESGVLKFLDEGTELYKGLEIRLYNGHSQGLVIPVIQFNEKKLVFMSDLIPTMAHIPASWICGYDTQPLVSMNERRSFLEEAFEKKYTLFFEHDIHVECCTLKMTEKGIRADQTFTLKDFIIN